MNFLYKYRGIITGFLAILLLLFPASPNFSLIGILIFLCSVILRIWARMHIGEHSRGYELACPEVVKTGPYKIIKHPLYVSNFLAGVSFTIFHAGFEYYSLIFCIIYAAFLGLLAHNENKFLQ